MPEQFRVNITPSEHVTAIVYPAPARDRIRASLLLAHGAGANQASDFIVRFATGLATRGVATITFNFLYTEQRKRLPDRNDKLEACYRKIIAAWHDGAFGEFGNEQLVIGGKSMGGRVASQVAASGATGIAGLVLLGYPLHPPGQPEKLRTRHLGDISMPMLFVQGSRDSFGTPEELSLHLAKLAAPTDLFVVEGGDHSFKVPKRMGLLQDQVYDSVLDHIVQWMRSKIALE